MKAVMRVSGQGCSTDAGRHEQQQSGRGRPGTGHRHLKPSLLLLEVHLPEFVCGFREVNDAFDHSND